VQNLTFHIVDVLVPKYKGTWAKVPYLLTDGVREVHFERGRRVRIKEEHGGR
jgi:hypothetical protein